MNDPVGTEIAATATWLEEHAAPGAATVLRRVARQRDQARRDLAAERSRPTAAPAAPQQPQETRQSADDHPSVPSAPEAARVIAMLRTDLARFQALAERAGWVPDGGSKRLWRWREGWWELGHRKKNPKDGYHDTGWYLWGPDGSFGEWVAPHKADAMTDADRLITQHLAATAEVKP
ncbi:hypothetical protein Q5762_14660 [Streptomyces sp. P9(2023)]|uniref:hypothetical protein n=1 Tax=Streptomyces sp. P9(2023) TaxID=3064394 RepID=UPI0028F43E21|nr:hypothetical protein [Streptomyces sp. P9(2023)]MDT9689557.1 hypothetical protein [Streptomyces sp. P9(2023)]